MIMAEIEVGFGVSLRDGKVVADGGRWVGRNGVERALGLLNLVRESMAL